MEAANQNRQRKPQRRLSVRQRQALATRNAILKAAGSLFLDRGYVSTTIEAIAESAGVAVSTVYFVFGSKLAVLRAIREQWHEQSQIKPVLEQARREDDPAARLELLARGVRRQWETSSGVISIYKQAAAADAEAAAELERALAGRRAALSGFVRDMTPILPPGVDASRVAAVVCALCLYEVFEETVRSSGWSEDEYEAWLAGELKAHIF